MASAPAAPRSVTCPRCHTLGRHATLVDCIAALIRVNDQLRDQVARLEFRVESRGQHAGHGGRRDRHDHRWVVLDGQRVCLSDAARELGLSASALHGRLVRRTGRRDYQDVDVRLLGVDQRTKLKTES